MDIMACRGDMELMELFLQYLEGNMVGTVGPDMLLGQECFPALKLVKANLPTTPCSTEVVQCPSLKQSHSLASLGLNLYPLVNLTTEHALVMTRALATLHANSMITQKSSTTEGQPSILQQISITNEEEDSTNDKSNIHNERETASENENNSSDRMPLVELGCVKDQWTAQVTQLSIVESNLSILVDALQSSGSNQRTVRRLEALRSDLPTLTQFLQFASAMQTQRIPSIGPICMKDIWVAGDDEEEEVLAIRLKGGKDLQGPPLRDAAWAWLTLLGGETLRERYMELCDEYCSSFNKVLLRQEALSTIEEMSYFDVMRDLGENFLHAFLTILHKFVVSGTWFFDRQLHTDDGLQALAEIIGFLG